MTTWPHSRASQKEHKTHRPRTNDISHRKEDRGDIFRVSPSFGPCVGWMLSLFVFHLVISPFKPGVVEVWTVDFGACSSAAAAMAPISGEAKREEVFQASP